MLDLISGKTNDFVDPIQVQVNGQFISVMGILPLCNTKTTLITSNGELALKAFENTSDATNLVLPLKNVIYDLNYNVDSGSILIIRPTREYIFTYCAGIMQPAKVTAGLEHIDDFQMDLIFKITDSLLADSKLIFTTSEQNNYNKLKTQWHETLSVTLDTATYEIDYAYNGSGEGATPKGLKSLARQVHSDYLNLLSFYRYAF